MEHLGVLKNSRKCVQIELESGLVGFKAEGKPGYPKRNLSEQGREPTNKLNPHMESAPRFKPKPHWWDASALSIAPPLSPIVLSHPLTLQLSPSGHRHDLGTNLLFVPYCPIFRLAIIWVKRNKMHF